MCAWTSLRRSVSAARISALRSRTRRASRCRAVAPGPVVHADHGGGGEAEAGLQQRRGGLAAQGFPIGVAGGGDQRLERVDRRGARLHGAGPGGQQDPGGFPRPVGPRHGVMLGGQCGAGGAAGVDRVALARGAVGVVWPVGLDHPLPGATQGPE
jgi:hypothetical protein